MRLWSLHPSYLDTKGLVATWREGLLAKKVLEGRTVGYQNHPQLQRFRACPWPLEAINCYLWAVWQEAEARGYRFDASKITPFDPSKNRSISVNRGQMGYELALLSHKLQQRDGQKYREISQRAALVPHPLFYLVDGPMEDWEKPRPDLVS